MLSIVLILLIVLLIGSVPAWPYSRNWGYFPSGIVGILLIIALVLLFTGGFPAGGL
jgi:hypothetical protein